VQSDGNGNVKADLTVTANWAPGNHTLTARDQNNHTTKQGSLVQIVAQGVDGTPGPHGSPSNSVSFSLKITINSQQLGTAQETLVITGKGDSGDTVCQTSDDGTTTSSSSKTITFSDGGQATFTEYSTSQCSGTYAAGHLNYVETTVLDEWDFANGAKCSINPHKKQVITGDFTSANTISGTFSSDGFTLQNCAHNGNPINVSGDTGTFTGTLSQ